MYPWFQQGECRNEKMFDSFVSTQNRSVIIYVIVLSISQAILFVFV